MNKIFRIENSELEVIKHCLSLEEVEKFVADYYNNSKYYLYVSHEITECDLSLSPVELEDFIFEHAEQLGYIDELYIERAKNDLCSLKLIRVAIKYKPQYTSTQGKIHYEYLVVLEYDLNR